MCTLNFLAQKIFGLGVRELLLLIALKSNLGSLLWFRLSLSSRSFLGQYNAKLSQLCESCRVKIALNPPYNTVVISNNRALRKHSIYIFEILLNFREMWSVRTNFGL